MSPMTYAARGAAISAAKKGKPGHPHTAAEKEAASAWMKRAKQESPKCIAATERLRAIALARRGTTQPFEWRKHISAGMTGSYANGRHRRMTEDEAQTLSRAGNMASCRKIRASRLEKAIWAVLDVLHVSYQTAVAFGPYVVDIYIPKRRLIIECDGAYWHSRAGAMEHDARRDAFMRNVGFTVLRLPELEIKSGRAIDILRRAVG